MNNFPDLIAQGYKLEKQLGQNFQGGRVTYLATEIDGDIQNKILAEQGKGQSILVSFSTAIATFLLPKPCLHRHPMEDMK